MIEVTYIDHMGTDLTTVNAARVSFKKHHKEFENSDTPLVNFLGKNEHISPFGHAFASFHVKAPIFVARQLVKHEYLRWNEISRRYVDEEPEFYVPEIARGRSKDKKQGSEGEVNSGYDLPYEILDISRMIANAYDWLLGEGMAPEQARMILPLNTMTEWYWSGSLDAFAKMCRLRLKKDAQYETRIVAQQISDKMEELFPVSWESLNVSSTS